MGYRQTPVLKSCIAGLLLLLCALALAGCGGGPAATPIPGLLPNIATESRVLDGGRGQPQVGEAAPDFTYILPDGTAHKLSDLRGQKVLLNFWASWCAPCQAEMPAIQRALDRYGPRGFAVLAVNYNETINVVQDFARANNVAFPLITNQSGDISQRYGVVNLPISYFISSDGTISYKKLGVMDTEFLAERIEALE